MIRKMTCTLLVGVICLMGITSAWAVTYKEAPMLKVEVATGELPRVEERLPEVPKVIEPLEEPGQYGGTLNIIHPFQNWCPEFWQAQREPLLETFPYHTDQVIANIVESWEASQDAKTFTFHLRKGMKYSDGVPVTTEDVLFTYEDILLNDKLTPAVPDWAKAGGEAMEMEIIDKYTFRVKFAVPNGSFPLQLHQHSQRWDMWMSPKHYLKELHPKYTPLEEIEPLIEKAGFGKGEWWRLFVQKANAFRSNEFTGTDVYAPTLCPWVFAGGPSSNLRVYERNPHYWKVDNAGNQLPYIDKVIVEYVTDMEVGTMKIINGEVDLLRDSLSLDKYSLYLEHAEEADYRILPLPSELGPTVQYIFNLTYGSEPELRKIINDVRFRKALSLGIKRDQMIDIVFMGLGEPVQVGLIPGSKYMPEDLIGIHTEYNPLEANRLLDEMGLGKRDKDGWRLRPDGEKLVLPIEMLEANAYVVPATEMVVNYWRELGVYTTMKVLGFDLWFERFAANDICAFVWHQCHSTDDVWTASPSWWVPIVSWASFGTLWYDWYASDGQTGEEPPPEVKKLYEYYRILQETLDEKERLEAAQGIIRSQADNFWRIGTVYNVMWPILVPANMRNVPEEGELSLWVCWNLEQTFLKEK